MKTLQFAVVLTLFSVLPVQADVRELISEDILYAIAAETSGEAAKRNLDTITLQHRMRSSPQFDAATDFIIEQLKHYDLDAVGTVEFKADGKTMYGTQKSRPVWEVRFAQLWEVQSDGDDYTRVRKLGDWDSVPLSLAQDSFSGDVVAALVDIGSGASDADYADKDIEGKLVLTSSQPGAVVEKAVGELGAAGIISYAPNQRSAWWKEDDRLVRWGHIGSFPKTKSFGFMISLGEARALKLRLAGGETILMHAKVDAGHTSGKYKFATAAIEGTDKRAEEIHFTCHLDHPRPGANDNASGCVAILEVARTLNALIKDGRFPRPSRSIRFLWPAEIEGSIMYLSEHDDPGRIKANIHMDMVGGAPVTKSVFRVSGGPYSVPSFISDLGHEIGHFVNDQSKRYADGETVRLPLVSPEGGKEPQLALMEGLDMGSDHDVFFEGSWQIPGLYLHDWPDRYIHTNFDTAANIDPTKLKRAAFIGAVSAWYLANLTDTDVPAVLALLQRNALKRSAVLQERRMQLNDEDAAASTIVHFVHERRKVHSVESFAALSESEHQKAVDFLAGLQVLMSRPEMDKDVDPTVQRNDTIYVRNNDVQGPMHAFGYSYAEDKFGVDKLRQLKLGTHSTPYGGGSYFTYEALNLVDGRRTVSDIRAWLVAELGAVPLAYVEEYLQALHDIGVIGIADSSQ